MFYRFVRGLASLWLRFSMRLTVKGRSHIPKEGACIICSNHMSWWDPVLVASLTPRVIHFMAKKELFEIPIIGKVFGRLNAFPVDRGKADVRAIRRSLKILKEAEVLGVFPEGTRNHNSNELARLHGGAAMLALRGEVPIVPIVIRGKYGLGSAVKVSIGEPFRLTAASGRFSSAVAEGSRRIAHEITELWKATDGEGA